MEKKCRTVDEYIRNSPLSSRGSLTEIRKAIKSVAPQAIEKISYGIPFYEHKGRLVYFGLQTRHIGLYIPPPIIEQHKKELYGFETTKSAVRIPLGSSLPIALIKKLVRARMLFNEQKRL